LARRAFVRSAAFGIGWGLGYYGYGYGYDDGCLVPRTVLTAAGWTTQWVNACYDPYYY
jgi:hypothetical protein